MAQIHNYQNEAQTFNDDDFYDIDFYNGTGYESKKILGSTIKAGIIASIPAPNVKTIYTDDASVTSDRTIRGVAGTHYFKMLDFKTLEFTALNTESTCFKINVPTGDSFTSFVIANTANNNPIISIEGGYLKINDKYKLPLADGSTGQILSTNGAGFAQWIDAPQTGVTSVESLTGAIDLVGDGIQIVRNTLNNSINFQNNEKINAQQWNVDTVDYFENDYFIFKFSIPDGFWFMELKPLPMGVAGWEFIASASIANTVNYPTFFENMNVVGIGYKIWPAITAKNNHMRFNVSIRPILNYEEPQPKGAIPLFQQECWHSDDVEGRVFQVSSVLRQIDWQIKVIG
jgi:hypothetical protein